LREKGLYWYHKINQHKEKPTMAMKDFKNKFILITGGASGAGLGQAHVFTEAGAKVIIADVNQQRLDEAVAAGAAVEAIKLDVTDREGWAKAADHIEQKYGETLDVLVLTAGVNVFGPAEASTYDDYDWVVGIVFGGVVNGLVTFVPRMIKKGKGGYIASTVSWGAFGSGASVAPYCAAKAAQLNLLESYYEALKPYGIGVTAVCPANINSHIYESQLRHVEAGHKTGYNVSEDTAALLATIHAHGMDPKVLANWMKDAMENDVFLCIPYKSGPEMVDDALSRMSLLASKEGIAKLAEKAKQPPSEKDLRFNAEREGYDVGVGRQAPEPPKSDGPQLDWSKVGFGKAAADRDFVDASKRQGA
jgi:NAD(P)-dependent dehydrogenase (short-subunit alcohol dehydrogenase family)